MIQAVLGIYLVAYLGLGVFTFIIAIQTKKQELEGKTWFFKFLYWHGVAFTIGFVLLAIVSFALSGLIIAIR